MKSTISLIAILAASISTSAIAADTNTSLNGWSIRPYVGLEYNYISANIKKQSADFDSNGTNDFSGKLNTSGYHAVVPNIGARIGNHLGFELGYLRSSEESKSLSGTDFLAGTSGTNDTRITGWHIDANGYLPLADKLEAIGSVGVGRYKAKTTVNGTIVAGGFALANGSASDDSSDTALRVGAGLQYAVTDHVNLRGMVRYVDVHFKDSGDKLADGAWTGAVGINYAF